MASPSLMDTLFQRSLDDIIKGLRNQQTGESAFISKVVEEIRREIKSTDLHIKSIALQKLTYLNSIYFIDMSWAAFHAIECISSPKFSHKKIGYLAISQSFHESTPVILLITNQLRKDLKSNNEFEVSLALQCLSTIGTVDLCRDLTSEVFTLMSTSKVFVRKKAIGLVLRVFAKYPDSVRVCFKRLVECLDGTDPQTVSAVVGVFCELASKDPKSYLPLAPEFYKILVDSRNNWVLIKVLKIFSKLAPLEPRLAKRVVEPICDHMRRTGAKSLVFECIRTVVTSFTDYDSAVKLAVSKVHEFLVDDDPNLKYLGLHALSILAPTHLWAVLENKEVVINSLSDVDPNIKLESLRLVIAMVSENNVVEICKVLVNYALKSDPEFCNEIIGSILSKCSENVYEIIVDFDWYVSLLGDLSRIPHCQKSEEIENQLVDIGMRVKDVRLELVRVCRELLIDPALLGNSFLHRILSAAAWVCGEYVEFSKNPIELVQALLQPRTSLLPPSIRTVYLQSAFKVMIFCLHSDLLQTELVADDVGLGLTGMESEIDLLGSSDLAAVNASPSCEQDEGFNPRDSNKSYEDVSLSYGRTDHTSPSLKKKGFMHESIINLINFIELALGPLLGSSDVEVHERAQNILGFIELVRPEIANGLSLELVDSMEEVKAYKIVELTLDAFSEELGPVSVKAQEKVAIPDGLVLKENLADLDAICGNLLLPPTSSFSLVSSQGESVGASVNISQSKEESETSSESTSLLAEHRKRHGLYYLPSEKNELSANEYPPANDPKSGIDTNNDALDLVKLADKSLVPKKKANHAKPRPMVVKLDEGETLTITSKKPDIKDDTLSDAVRDVLLGNAAIPASSQSQSNSSVKRKGKEKENVDLPESKGHFDGEKPDLGNPSSRRSKHRSHGKEKGRKSPVKKNDVEREDHGEKVKQKSRHRHGRHKTRQRSDGPVNLDAQAPVIPDFLL